MVLYQTTVFFLNPNNVLHNREYLGIKLQFFIRTFPKLNCEKNDQMQSPSFEPLGQAEPGFPTLYIGTK